MEDNDVSLVVERHHWTLHHCAIPDATRPLHLLLKFEMKTTSTAQYAALAANSSCLFALVRRLMAAEKSSVKTTNIPTASKVELRSPIDVSLYMATTGNTSRMKIMSVMIRPTNFSIRDWE
jgi:hypothetical protein